MKKIISLTTISLIILGCGSQYQGDNFVQPTPQMRPVHSGQIHYASKSVEDIKRDLAQDVTKKPSPQKSTSANIQPPPPIKISTSAKPNLPPKNAINTQEKVEKAKPTPKEALVTKTVEQKSKSIAEVKKALQQPPPVTKTAERKSKPVAEVKPNKQESPTNLPAPTIKPDSPSIATIKDFIEDHAKNEEKKSDKTVVIIQQQAKDGKPKAALKISNARSKIVASGKQLIGTPYLFGGTTRSGFDCSGLVQYVYKKHGFSVPRTSRNQFASLKSVKNPQPGDLVFFRHGNKPVNHVGIYVGDNKMLHAPSTGKRVKIVDIDTKYWKKRYAGARRVLEIK